MRRILPAAFASILITLGGCSTWPQKTDSTADSNKLIAIDFVNAMMQIDSLHPSSTTVQFELGSDLKDPYIKAFKDTLQEAGYGIQIVSSPTGKRLVKHKVSQNRNQNALRTDTHEVFLGLIHMLKKYQIDENGYVRPASNLFVKGADIAGVRKNDTIFDPDSSSPSQTKPASPDMLVDQTVVQPALTSSEKNDQSQKNQQPPADNLFAANTTALDNLDGNRSLTLKDVMPPVMAKNEPVQSSNPDQPNAEVPAMSTGALIPNPDPLFNYTQNMAVIGESNYKASFGGYLNVDEQILTFDNDSLRLGETNKWHIQQAVQHFNPTSDKFSIVGCSLGPTKLKSGNEGLAIGRANRVKEALIFAGVPQGSILDEGCWATESIEKMPSRGVVLVLKRKGDA